MRKGSVYSSGRLFVVYRTGENGEFISGNYLLRDLTNDMRIIKVSAKCKTTFVLPKEFILHG